VENEQFTEIVLKQLIFNEENAAENQLTAIRFKNRILFSFINAFPIMYKSVTS